MADNGTTNWPLDTDDLNLPSDMDTRAPTSAGDGHYTLKQWYERVTGMLRATAHDLITAMTHNLPMGGFKITGLGTPTASTDAATKAYVDATAQGLSVKQSAKGASTTNHSISAFAGSTIDGGSVSLSNGDRILLKDQSTASQNGPWVFNGAGSALSRPTDFAHGAQEAGAFVFVESGTTNANRGFVLSGASVVVDTDAETWVQFSGAGEITAGAGLTKTGDTINAVANADGSITVNADDIQLTLDATAPTTSAVGDAAAAGSAARAAHRDHTHGRESFASPSISLGTAAAAGAAATPIRSDATIVAFDATAPTTSAVGDAAATGAATVAARRDHTHGRESFGSVTAQTSYGGASANGSATTPARSDHTHGTPALGGASTQAAPGNDPLGVGYPRSMDPLAANSTYQATGANTSYWFRSDTGGTITKIGLYCNVSSGNVAVFTYTNSGSGRAAKPGARSQTSASVACPGSGAYSEVALGGSVAVPVGDWIGIGSDNATATFLRGNSFGGAFLTGRNGQANSFPPADPAPTLTVGGGIAYMLVGA